MKKIIEDIQKTMGAVTPVFNHQMKTADAFRILSTHFFDMGMKLKVSGTPEQLKKYTEVTNALNDIRGEVLQNFIHEANVNAHEKNEIVYKNRIKELEDQIRKSNSDNDILK